MRIIGITGGIGTGKSTVLEHLQKKYNAYIIETDKLAHQLMLPGERAYQQIIEIFGEKILDENAFIDRRKLGGIVFNNPEDLKKLNEIVHPLVKEYILQDIEKKKKEKEVSFYIIEAALLIEDGYRSICDELWYIHANDKERIQRLIAGRGGNEKKWKQIIDNQSQEDYYFANCDYIIDNGKSFENTANIVKELLF